MALRQITETAPDAQPFHMGDRIRKAREFVGMDRQTFAETVGIHRDTLAKYEETGKAKRSALISIAWASKARLEWLETGALPWREVGLDGLEPPTITVESQHFAPVVSLAERRASKLSA